MMRMIGFAAVLAVVSGTVTYSYAGPNQQMRCGGMMRGGMDSDSMCAMHSMGCGMGMMMPRQILGVEDGIIVSVGNKLIKYNKDLNKKKEVMIEIDMKAMEKMMEQMHQAGSQKQDMGKPAPESQKKK